MSMQSDHFAISTQHLADAERRVAEQKARIAKLEDDGQDATYSRDFLHVLERSLELMMDHHALILREIAEQR